MVTGLTLNRFDFQEKAVMELLALTTDSRSKQTIVVKSPTGSGKTIILIGFVDEYLNKVSSGKFGRRGKPLAAMKKRFVVAKVKSGVLRGFMLLDMDWTKEERDTVIKIIENMELDLNQAERSQDYGY